MSRRSVVARWHGAPLLAALVLAACDRAAAPEPGATASARPVDASPATHVGREACRSCHPAQDAAWQGSHHALAMQVADATTVEGDFAEAKFTYAGITSTFFRRDGKHFVRTDGADGALRDHEIAYTFGVWPLQQYLIELDHGRIQALSIAWDARAKEDGGQRWFHLYPDEHVTHDDELHWTGIQQNWNFQCADCHSTNLRRGYDPATRTYHATWSELDVSCEACHGPGSRHVAWANGDAVARAADASMGLVVSFAERRSMGWTMDAATGTARPRVAHPLSAEIDACAPCHARRTTIAEGAGPGTAFLDAYLPALLLPPLYHVDGQQREEVYVWGSFVQSRMYQQGVTCSDCHDPHSGTLRAEGNALCAQCHSSAKYDATAHHHHAPGQAGSRCVDCHAPETTYMVVDARRDHSFRVPRPDQSVDFGVPNACNRCHADRSSQWAADEVVRWFGHVPSGLQHQAPALAAASRHEPSAVPLLAALLEDRSQSDLVRASAVAALVQLAEPSALEAAARGLGDGSALVRHEALGAVEPLPVEQLVRLAAPLLDDKARSVRIEAARVLAAAAAATPAAPWQASFERAAAEYEASQRMHADRPEHRTNLGTFLAARGRFEEAVVEYREALELQRSYVPAWANLADLRRVQGRDAEAEVVLREALGVVPRDASLHHALGLTLVRLQRSDESLRELAEAAALAPEDVRFAYVHAVALHSAGRMADARRELVRALAVHPRDRDLLAIAATMSRDAGDAAAAIAFAERLVEASPSDRGAQQLLLEMRAAAPR